MTVRIQKPAFNIREKLSELERPIGLKGSELMRAETAQDAFSLIGAGRRNMIINGRFLVSQRGTYTSLTTPTSNTYYLDRWFWNGTINGNSGIQLKTDQVVNGFTNLNTYYYTSSNSSAASSGQTIEDSLWSHLKGKKVTFSAWVKTNNSRVGLRFYTGVQNYGPRHSGSGNWEYLTWTFTIPSGATYLYPLIDSYNGSFNDGPNTYIEITMVQVEEGTIATPFEHRSYGEELALCQRYCYVIRGDWPAATAGEVLVGNGVWNGIDQAYIKIEHPVTMLKVPAIDYGNLGWYRVVAEAVSWRGISSLSLLTDACSINSTTIAVAASTDTRGLVARMATQTTSAKLILSSEL